MNFQKEALIKYRLEKSETTFNEALALAQKMDFGMEQQTDFIILVFIV